VLPPRLRALLTKPWPWVLMVYACGIALRLLYTLRIQNPERVVYADMGLYVGLGRRYLADGGPVDPGDVLTPMGYPALIAFLLSGGGSLTRVINLQIVLSCLVPLVVGALGWAAYGRRTGLLALVFASLYYPFIEYGALLLTEIHSIFWTTLAFTAFFAARRVERRGAALGLAAAGGLALSIAAAFKSVALVAGFLFFVVDGVGLAVARAAYGQARSWVARLKPWVLRGAMVAVAAAPIMIVLARVCTRANEGRFCVTGNKLGSDLLLGHYGRIADLEWKSEGHDLYRFGSPGALLRHHDPHAKVPFSMTDNARNTAEAWRWTVDHPGESIVLSLDHIYDTFFGSAQWPTFNHDVWPLANLSQYAFVIFLFVPTVLGCASVLRRGLRASLTSQTALVLAPVVGLTFTVAIATGEVRYRVPFDVFFIAIACAYLTGDLARVDGAPASAAIPGGAGAAAVARR